MIRLVDTLRGISQELKRSRLAAAEPIEVFPGIIAPIPRIGHLIALKFLSESEQRLKDRMDLQALFAFGNAAEVALARDAARLITERGYHRGRDLLSALDAWVARASAGSAIRS